MNPQERQQLTDPGHVQRARQIARDGSVREAMTVFAEGFHVLQGAPGVRPWDVEKLYIWATTSGAPTGATLHAVRCVMEIWNGNCIEVLDEANPSKDARLGSFHAIDAMASWDSWNRAAFVAWCQDPWWP